MSPRSGHIGRIIFFSPGQAEAGGCARHARLLSEDLAARGWQVVAICRAATVRRFHLRRKPNLVVIEIPGFSSRFGAGLYVLVGGLIGLAYGRNAMFVAMQLASQTLTGGLCARVYRRPFVALSTISGEISEAREALESPLRFVHRQNLRRADYLIGQTPAAARELQAFAPAERVAVVHNPMPLGGRGALDGRPIAVYTGRLTKQKDLGVLLEAWQLVVERLPQSQLTLMGEGGEYGSVEGELREMVACSADLGRTVTFTGWVDDVERYLCAADVYVLPSRSEGMSNSLLEACAWRRIVVASDIEPNRVVLGNDYPLLFRTGDATALATALITAFEDAGTRAAAVSSIDRRVAELSRNSAATKLEELLFAADRARH